MPADVTGTRVILDREDGRRELVFVEGPLFSHVLLADEINRATPKTQSALLEAMAELQVTVAGTTYRLSPPFFVLATLNPIEMEGTYPLPEAQLDRFFFKVHLPYPGHAEMKRILATTTGAELAKIEPVFVREEAPLRLEELKRLVREVMVAPHIEDYAAAVVRATHPDGSSFVQEPGLPGLVKDDFVNKYVSFGSSPRGGQALILAAKVHALLAGRANVATSDVDRAALAALNHRLVLNFAAEAEGVSQRLVVERALHEQIDRRIVGRNGIGQLLQEDGLAAAWRGYDQRPLPLAQR